MMLESTLGYRNALNKSLCYYDFIIINNNNNDDNNNNNKII